MFKRLFFLCSTVWETQTFTLGGFDSIRQLTTLGRFPVILNRENCFFLHVTEGDIPENSGNTRHDGKHLPEIEDDALGNITHWTTDVEPVKLKKDSKKSSNKFVSSLNLNAQVAKAVTATLAIVGLWLATKPTKQFLLGLK